MQRSIKGRQRLPRAIMVIMDSTTPTITEGGNEVSVVKNGTGDVTLTFTLPFKRTPSIGANGASGDYISLSAVSTTSCRLIMKTDAGVAADGLIHVQIFGWDAVDAV